MRNASLTHCCSPSGEVITEHGPARGPVPELLPVRVWRLAGEARDP